MFIRYVQKDGERTIGLFMGGYDLSSFSAEEMEEFYSHPAQLPSPDLACDNCFFAFNGEGAEARWSRMIQLRIKAAIGVVERVEVSPEEFDVVWSDEDQVALVPK